MGRAVPRRGRAAPPPVGVHPLPHVGAVPPAARVGGAPGRGPRGGVGGAVGGDRAGGRRGVRREPGGGGAARRGDRRERGADGAGGLQGAAAVVPAAGAEQAAEPGADALSDDRAAAGVSALQRHRQPRRGELLAERTRLRQRFRGGAAQRTEFRGLRAGAAAGEHLGRGQIRRLGGRGGRLRRRLGVGWGFRIHRRFRYFALGGEHRPGVSRGGAGFRPQQEPHDALVRAGGRRPRHLPTHRKHARRRPVRRLPPQIVALVLSPRVRAAVRGRPHPRARRLRPHPHPPVQRRPPLGTPPGHREVLAGGRTQPHQGHPAPRQERHRQHRRACRGRGRRRRRLLRPAGPAGGGDGRRRGGRRGGPPGAGDGDGGRPPGAHGGGTHPVAQTAPRRHGRGRGDHRRRQAHRRHAAHRGAVGVRGGGVARRLLGTGRGGERHRRGLPVDLGAPLRGRRRGALLAAHAGRAVRAGRLRIQVRYTGHRGTGRPQSAVLRRGGSRRGLRAAGRREARPTRPDRLPCRARGR
mmetsp:Transcript_26186/g.52178  ORF Transcript_26186/g.52178 Transcript_26186/m.52178 type:complete len:524 (+) Transcript_26186:600-2171(+)